LVVSNTLFNRHTGLAIVCPLTNTDRSFPFHVAVVNDPNVTGFVMVEQVKSIDFRARRAKRMGEASDQVLDEVLSILDACIY
jgi:mRNA interferase MazF